MSSILVLLCLLWLSANKIQGQRERISWLRLKPYDIARAVDELPRVVHRDGMTCQKTRVDQVPFKFVIYHGQCQPGYEDALECEDAIKTEQYERGVKYSCSNRRTSRTTSGATYTPSSSDGSGSSSSGSSGSSARTTTSDSRRTTTSKRRQWRNKGAVRTALPRVLSPNDPDSSANTGLTYINVRSLMLKNPWHGTEQSVHAGELIRPDSGQRREDATANQLQGLARAETSTGH